MKNKKIINIVSLSMAMVMGLGIGLATISASADEVETNGNTSFISQMKNRFSGQGQKQNPNRPEITDEEKELFQDMTQEERMQYMQENYNVEPGQFNGKKNKQGQKGGIMGFLQNENVTAVSENISNGLQVTVTTDDSELLEKMHMVSDKMSEREMPEDSDVQIAVEKIDNGVIIITTSDDSEKVIDIQNHAKVMEIMQELKAEGVDVKESITTEVEVVELDNGVQIVKTLISDNELVQELLKLKKYDRPQEKPNNFQKPEMSRNPGNLGQMNRSENNGNMWR